MMINIYIVTLKFQIICSQITEVIILYFGASNYN